MPSSSAAISSLLRSGQRLLYHGLLRPAIFRLASPQQAHDQLMRLLALLDGADGVQPGLHALRRAVFPQLPVAVGGVQLDYPAILAAGFVKGQGFATEDAALLAVAAGRNIIPGWRSMAALLGPVELGSVTRHPRLGNQGEVLWRHAATRSTQNRVGLRNPGAAAVAAFLARQQTPRLPPQMGINIAVSPGVDDPAQQQREVTEALACFQKLHLRPAWYTLNLSCPNTEDDPRGHQTDTLTRELCGAMLAQLGGAVPLWVKVSPGLGAAQYHALMAACAAVGVRAVIATNTLPQPAPPAPHLSAGVGGGRLHTAAVHAAAHLMEARQRHDYPVAVIGCGGVMNRATAYDFQRIGVGVVQYWSALVYEGLFAAASFYDAAAAPPTLVQPPQLSTG